MYGFIIREYYELVVVLCILGTSRVALIMHNVLLASIIYYYIMHTSSYSSTSCTRVCVEVVHV